MYIKRNYITGRVSELAIYIGDDGTQAISYFPPQNESTPTDFLAYDQLISLPFIVRSHPQEISTSEILHIKIKM